MEFQLSKINNKTSVWQTQQTNTNPNNPPHLLSAQFQIYVYLISEQLPSHRTKASSKYLLPIFPLCATHHTQPNSPFALQLFNMQATPPPLNSPVSNPSLRTQKIASQGNLSINEKKRAVQSRGETKVPEMSVGEREVSDWLTLHGVNKYTQTLIDGGCSSLEILKY